MLLARWRGRRTQLCCAVDRIDIDIDLDIYRYRYRHCIDIGIPVGIDIEDFSLINDVDDDALGRSRTKNIKNQDL